ncbi:MAG: DUF2971 domain-containing protein [Eubacteriales bacterium]|nr:DUF2971 domain-containing protein [Eubacteriales bacterium]
MDNIISVVYHYCSIETFKNILKSKVLWLSDLTDSNDNQEVIRTFVNLWDNVKRKLLTTDLSEDVLNDVIQMIDSQYKTELLCDPPYGICFCKNEDILSQWKEYGDNTKGVSLGFDLSWFERNGIKQQMPHPNSIQSKSIGYEKVVYHSSEFEQRMAELCYEIIKCKGTEAWITYIRPTFKRYSGFVKNPTFAQEDEIRLVYYPLEDQSFSVKDIDVSDLKTCVKKHYEIPWITSSSQALKSICIGNNCELTKEDIRKLLIDMGINVNIDITESQCSYRIRNN